MRPDNPTHWDPSPKNVFKLNFDGSSKGNLSRDGFGGAIRNSQGNITLIFYGNSGFNSNNAAKLDGLIVGLSLVKQKGLLPIIVEGDSAIILSMASKLLHGSQVSKVATSWRLAHGINSLASLLQNMHAITFHHVRRKSNSLADFLANSGVNSPHSLVEGTLHDSLNEQIRTKCPHYTSSDLSRPDAGDNTGDTRPTFWPLLKARVTLETTQYASALHQQTQGPLRMREISPVTSAHANRAGEGMSS